MGRNAGLSGTVFGGPIVVVFCAIDWALRSGRCKHGRRLGCRVAQALLPSPARVTKGVGDLACLGMDILHVLNS